MHPESDPLSKALIGWAAKMAAGLRLQAEAFDILGETLSNPTSRPWGPTSDLSLVERPQRQALLLAAVRLRSEQLDAEGIPRQEWLQLAEHFGYDRRGTAGFFRRSPDGAEGLLVMEDNSTFVRVAEAGLERVRAFKPVLEHFAPEIGESVKQLQEGQ